MLQPASEVVPIEPWFPGIDLVRAEACELEHLFFEFYPVHFYFQYALYILRIGNICKRDFTYSTNESGSEICGHLPAASGQREAIRSLLG
jgi:hypothetical protein